MTRTRGFQVLEGFGAQPRSLLGNQLVGSIPTEIGNLASLTNLVLSVNKLDGQIPSEIGNIDGLTALSLFDNRLSGPIPATIGRLTSLQILLLCQNQLSGKIPSEIGTQLPHLRVIMLHKNLLEGQFPARWTNAEGMLRLTLHDNRLRGSLPSSLQNMTRLRYLTLHGNDFSGTVPRLSLPEGAKATLHRNRFSCELPASLAADDVNVSATVVMGNMVSAGDAISANWVRPTELQEFLYVSSRIWWGNMVVLAGLPVTVLGAVAIYSQSRQASAGIAQAPVHEIGLP